MVGSPHQIEAERSEGDAVAVAAPDYPIRFDVDYPERLNRVTTLVRMIGALPLFVLLWAVGNLTVFAPLLLILFRRKYPRWFFDWNLALSRLTGTGRGLSAAAPRRLPLERRGGGEVSDLRQRAVCYRRADQ